ncbi:MAG: hypothetical protein R3266_04670 [Gemmatimonadota bacterium]|nr:hypothetical protein [Gemmatimonadota bacterium]
MDLPTVSMLGQAVGGFFVVVSLIYLARQVRQQSELLITENYGRVLERMSAIQSQLGTDRELSHLLVIGAQSPGALTSSERVRFSWAMYELFGAGEFMYNQAQEDALPPKVWERWKTTIAWWISHPGMQAWWEAKPSPFTSDFEGFIKDLIRGEAWDHAAIDRWETFVAGEGLAGGDSEPTPPEERYDAMDAESLEAE